MLHDVLTGAGLAFLTLFPVVNPVGNLPAFVTLTEGDEPRHRHRQALRTGVWVFGLLALFALAGTALLHALGIGLSALQVAGGLVVAHAGFGMVSPRERLSTDEQDHAQAKPDVSFSPMAMPLLAGPGALGVVIGISARGHGLGSRLGVVLGALAIAVLVVVVLRLGQPLVDRLGPTGVGALTRIFGFLILAIGVELLAHGVLDLAPGLGRR